MTDFLKFRIDFDSVIQIHLINISFISYVDYDNLHKLRMFESLKTKENNTLLFRSTT